MSTFPEKKRYNNVNDFFEPHISVCKAWEVIIKTGVQQYGLEIWEVLHYLKVNWSEYQWDEHYNRPYAHKVHEDFKVMQESKYKN